MDCLVSGAMQVSASWILLSSHQSNALNCCSHFLKRLGMRHKYISDNRDYQKALVDRGNLAEMARCTPSLLMIARISMQSVTPFANREHKVAMTAAWMMEPWAFSWYRA